MFIYWVGLLLLLQTFFVQVTNTRTLNSSGFNDDEHLVYKYRLQQQDTEKKLDSPINDKQEIRTIQKIVDNGIENKNRIFATDEIQHNNITFLIGSHKGVKDDDKIVSRESRISRAYNRSSYSSTGPSQINQLTQSYSPVSIFQKLVASNPSVDATQLNQQSTKFILNDDQKNKINKESSIVTLSSKSNKNNEFLIWTNLFLKHKPNVTIVMTGPPRIWFDQNDSVVSKLPSMLEHILQQIQSYFSVYKFTDSSRPYEIEYDDLYLNDNTSAPLTNPPNTLLDNEHKETSGNQAVVLTNVTIKDKNEVIISINDSMNKTHQNFILIGEEDSDEYSEDYIDDDEYNEVTETDTETKMQQHLTIGIDEYYYGDDDDKDYT